MHMKIQYFIFSIVYNLFVQIKFNIINIYTQQNLFVYEDIHLVNYKSCQDFKLSYITQLESRIKFYSHKSIPSPCNVY